MEYTTDLLEILNNIDPSLLDYQEWCNVGMALKYEGYTANDWDYWSQRDSKDIIKMNAIENGSLLLVQV